jgi:hypothetical protein
MPPFGLITSTIRTWNTGKILKDGHVTTISETMNAASFYVSCVRTVGMNARSAPVSYFRVLRSSLSQEISHPPLHFHGFDQLFWINAWTLH